MILLDLGKFGITLEILQTPKNSKLELKKLSTSPYIYSYFSCVFGGLSKVIQLGATSNAQNSVSFCPISKIQNPAEPCVKEHLGMSKITLLAYLLRKLRLELANM